MNTQILLKSRPTAKVSPDNFEIVTNKIEKPSKPGKLLIQNLYLSLEPAMRGWLNDVKSYVPPVQIGEVMRGACVGIVLESTSSKFQPGDHVFGFMGWQKYALLDEKLVMHKIKNIPGIPLTAWLGPLGSTGLTAYFGLLEIGLPKPGETVLVSGAAGGVGQVAGQIAKIKGCRTVGIAGSDKKCSDLISKYGYDVAINYKTSKNLHQQVFQSCPKGVDVFFDNVGGEILDIALARLNKRARIVLCGGISQYEIGKNNFVGPKNYIQLLVTTSKMQGFIVTDYAQQWPQAIQEIIGWMKEGKLKYGEHIIEGIEQAPKALPLLFSGGNDGKLIIKISDPSSKL